MIKDILEHSKRALLDFSTILGLQILMLGVVYAGIKILERF